MILLTVISYNGAPCQGPASSFDELGGSIGRADNNQLVLPDPERTISRVHARIVFRAGGYSIVDNGSNPISVNGKPLGSGREHPLQPGDQVQIGGYLIEAAAGAAAARSDDPFADLFGSGAGGLAAPAAPSRPGLAPAPAWAPAP
ncbi:MAG: FHA domain-containing protein, partial [Burkholderiales bacterium]|nr:FHA domain-containing protein [Burkholderiales bacterium]